MIDILLNTWPWNTIMPITLGGMLGGFLVWRARKGRVALRQLSLLSILISMIVLLVISLGKIESASKLLGNYYD